jgi:hypothetical protein
MKIHYLLVLIVCFSCGSPNDSHRQMARILEKTNEQQQVPENPYMHELRISLFDSMLNEAYAEEEKIRLLFLKSQELLNAGHSEQAADSYQTLISLLESYETQYPQQVKSALHTAKKMLAISYLRIGEQQNCLLNHTSASCIIPLKAPAYHQNTFGSGKALEMYEKILRETPQDLNSRWLYNVAAMTLGRYPEAIPQQWRIDLKYNTSTFPTFRDVAPEVGLAHRGLSGGVVVEDFNQDGLLDVMMSSWGLNDPLRYFQNTGAGYFADKTEESGLTGITGGLNLVHTDYNNDGLLDVLVLRGAWMGLHGRFPNSLLSVSEITESGVPYFRDVTVNAGLLSFMPTQTATWYDFNQDGWLDLFIGNENLPEQKTAFSCELYLNQRDGTFREVAREADLNLKAYVKGVTAADYNQDGWPDIYISTLEGRNYLMKNEGPDAEAIPRFSDNTASSGLLDSINSFPTWFWDYDQDGDEDIFVIGYSLDSLGNIAGKVAAEHLGVPVKVNYPHLYQNQGDGTYEDVTATAGLQRILHSMGCGYGDLEHDGWPDMYLATGDPDFRSVVPNLMFSNVQGSHFQDVTFAGGFGNLQKGHGVSFADLDNDGDQDVYTVMGGANYGDVYQNLLFENPFGQLPEANSWIYIRLQGNASNRPGIGARIQLEVIDSGKRRTIHRTVSTGTSFGNSPFRQEIGLGKAAVIKKLSVHWPAGQTDIFTNVAVNQLLEITEGEAAYEILEMPQVDFSASPHNHMMTHQ